MLLAREGRAAERNRVRGSEEAGKSAREEDENGIRGTVGGEEAGKAGSRFRGV